MKELEEMADASGMDCLLMYQGAEIWNASRHQLLALANAIEAKAAAKEREAIMDEWAMCVQSDLENGVKWMNDRAAAEWADRYPQMAGFAAAIEKLGATDGNVKA